MKIAQTKRAVNPVRQILITFSPFATLWNKGIYVTRLPEGPEFGLVTAVLNTPVCGT
jgi:hypothetical protein